MGGVPGFPALAGKGGRNAAGKKLVRSITMLL